jgi:hypothetical protein
MIYQIVSIGFRSGDFGGCFLIEMLFSVNHVLAVLAECAGALS